MKMGIKAVKRKSMDLKQELVRFSELQPEKRLPLVIKPNVPDVDINEWVKSHEDLLHSELMQRGGVLFRGFQVNTSEDFDRFVSSHCKQLLVYNESTSPRTKLTSNVYTSTEHPQDQKILLHNELSYASTWPLKIWFCAIKVAEQGGETPIADVRRVYERIDPQIRETFAEKGWMLVRNYGDGFGLTWQQAFHTEEKQEVERYCQEHEIEYEWKSGDRLFTRQKRIAIRQHPITGENVWFNHLAFYHEASLNPDLRAMFQREFGSSNMPFNTFYGDGTPIADEVVAAIHEAYEQETVMFPWQKGDVMALDNMLVAHARSPFVGERKTLVAMGEPFSGVESQHDGV